MGTRGAVPKRSGERLGHTTKAEEADVDKVVVQGPVRPPAARTHWKPIVKTWFESLKTSGQRKFYEPSDWAFALYLGEVMHHSLGTHTNEDGAEVSNMTAAIVRAVMAGMTALLVTEADRRRARVEITRAAATKATPVAVMDDYRDALAPPAKRRPAPKG